MSENCCNTNPSNKEPNKFDHKDAIQERYGSAALEQESCLCTPVGFNPVLLEAIPQEVIERDYGCGDPTKYAYNYFVAIATFRSPFPEGAVRVIPWNGGWPCCHIET